MKLESFGLNTTYELQANFVVATFAAFGITVLSPPGIAGPLAR